MGAANARSAEELAGAESAHSGWAPADYSAGLPGHDSAPVGVPVALWAAGLVPVSVPAGSAVLRAADSAPVYLVPAGSVARLADGWAPAEYSARADPSAPRCSPDAPPVCWLVAELRHDSPERYKVSPLVSRVRRRGR